MRRAPRILLTSAAIALVGAGTVVALNAKPNLESIEPAACAPTGSDYKLIGSPLTAAQVEQMSAAVLTTQPDAGQVPFGPQHNRWLDLKRKMQPGDAFYEFSDDITGGYALVRSGCVVDDITDSIR